MMDRTGEHLGNYRLVRQLGQGGFASVYLGEHCHLGTQAAIKLLHGPLQQADVQAFREEARLIAQLQHPHIIRVLDYSLAGQTPYLVMDYAPGGTLRARHPRGTRLEPRALLPYLKEVVMALEHAHRYGVIHRDVKPENLLIGKQEEILLADFGIALLSQSQAQQTGPVVGTAAYMAPEQAQGKPGRASDQYALGIMLYEWLTGWPPFQGTLVEVLSQHVLKQPPPLRQVVGNLPAAAEEVVLKALAKNPRDRFVSLSRLVYEFEQAIAQKAAPLPSPPAQIRAEQAVLTTTVSPGQEEHEKPLKSLSDPQMQACALAKLKALGIETSQEQQQMLFSPASSLSVLAGAGSGKSTTLVLRLLLMHKLLHIPLEDIHLFSFTRASSAEVRSKLLDRLLAWEARIEGRPSSPVREKQLRDQLQLTVTTFHSVIKGLQRAALPGENLPLFDLLGARPEASAADTAADFNPFVTALSEAQVVSLRATHTAAYHSSPRYRNLVDQLIEENERRVWLRLREGKPGYAEKDEARWQAFLRREWDYQKIGEHEQHAQLSQDTQGDWHTDPYRAALADHLYRLKKEFTPWASFTISCPLAGGAPGELQAAFQVDNLYFHVQRFATPQEDRLFFHERYRQKMIARYAEAPDCHRQFLHTDFERQRNGKITLTAAGMQKLLRLVRLRQHANSASSAPSTLVELPGALRRLDLVELLYQEGIYVESLGLEVDKLTLQPAELEDPISALVAELLPLFWHALEEHLDQTFVRFHTILRQLCTPETLTRLGKQIGSLRHTLIDEFQDVSPEIVGWLMSTQQQLRNQLAGADKTISMTGIGDEYQSIYGWRGAQPGYLLHFHHFFGADQEQQVQLETNFRSRQPILLAAEALLEDVSQKSNKRSISSIVEWESRCWVRPLMLWPSPLCWRGKPDQLTIWKLFGEHVGEVLQDLQAALLRLPLKETGTLSVKVLARTNSSLTLVPDLKKLAQELRDHLKQQGIEGIARVSVDSHTIHRAKGLEADVVLLVDDILPPRLHPFREQVYKHAQMPGGYTELMHDEARRLAYVALTRARLGLLWVPLTMSGAKSQDEGAGEEGEEPGQSLEPNGAFLIVKRFLEAQMSPALTASGAADPPV